MHNFSRHEVLFFSWYYIPIINAPLFIYTFLSILDVLTNFFTNVGINNLVPRTIVYPDKLAGLRICLRTL